MVAKYMLLTPAGDIPEFSSLTSEDIALVTESAATSRSFLRLRTLPVVDAPLDSKENEYFSDIIIRIVRQIIT